MGAPKPWDSIREANAAAVLGEGPDVGDAATGPPSPKGPPIPLAEDGPESVVLLRFRLSGPSLAPSPPSGVLAGSLVRLSAWNVSNAVSVSERLMKPLNWSKPQPIVPRDVDN